MSDTIIELENISKQYRLGQVGTWWLSSSTGSLYHPVEAQTLRGITFGEGLRRFQRPGLSSSTGSLYHSVEVWWHTLRGKDDPTLKIGASNKLDTVEGEYVWALRDINLEVKQGEVLGIIGKNGAGKSTKKSLAFFLKRYELNLFSA